MIVTIPESTGHYTKLYMMQHKVTDNATLNYRQNYVCAQVLHTSFESCTM